MKKRLGVLGAAVGLLALAVGAVSPALGSSSGGSASASSDDANDGQTIRVIAVFKETAEIDVGAQGFSQLGFASSDVRFRWLPFLRHGRVGVTKRPPGQVFPHRLGLHAAASPWLVADLPVKRLDP